MPRSLLLAAFAFLKHATGGAVPAGDLSVTHPDRPRGVLVWIHADTSADRIALLETAGFQDIEIHHRHGYSWSVKGKKA